LHLPPFVGHSFYFRNAHGQNHVDSQPLYMCPKPAL
jgi:hypothetical protein